MKKRILACLLTLCVMLGLASALGLSASAAANTYTMTAIYNNGDFTVELQPGDKVTISNAEELSYLAAYTNAGKTTAYAIFELNADIVLNNGTFAADGSWNGEGEPVAFTSIGASGFDGSAFRGRFNGNGHSISGLYINDTACNFAGLFGHVAGTAVICDLTVKNSYISGGYYVGGIAGLAQANAAAPVFDNCSFEGFVSGTRAVGGILGGSHGSTIINCTNYGTVSGVASVNGLGGILGTGVGAVQIVNCMNAGTVGNSIYNSYAGGIAGLLSGISTGTVANCANAGAINASVNCGAIIGSNEDNATVANNYYLANTAPVGVGNVNADVSAATVATRNLAQAEIVGSLNTMLAASAENLNGYCAWTALDGELVLTRETALVAVTVGTAVNVCATLPEAVAIANANEGCTVSLLRNGTTGAAELNGTYTIDFNGKHLTATAPLTLVGGTLLITDSSEAMGGITSVGCSALVMSGENTPTLKINDGYVVSTVDAANRDSVASFAIVNYTKGNLLLSGSPYIKGGAGIALYVGYQGTLYGADGDTEYEGTTLGVSCGWAFDDDQILAKDAKEGQFYFRDYDTSSYNVKVDGSVYTVESIAFFPWILFTIITIIAAGVVIFTIVHTVRFTRRMKYLSVSLPVMFPVLTMITGAQTIAMIVAGGVCVAALVTCVLLTRFQNKKYAQAKAAKEQADAEAAAKAAEEAAAAEAAAKAAEEAAAAEAAAKAAEEAAAEAAAKAAEEAAAEAAAKAAEEAAAAEAAAKAAEEAAAAEAAAKAAAAEAAAKAAEEAAAEAAAKAAEEAAAAEAAVKAAEEAVEETEEVEEEKTLEEAAEEIEEETTAAAATPAAPPKVRPDRLVVAETDANGNVIYSAYKKSFTARVIQSPADVQERYETLKNALLSYKKVNSRVSWSYDSIKSGRKQLAKFAIRGKSLCLFLALDPGTLEDSKYNIADAGNSKKYETVPCRLRLSSKRSIKWGLELISILAEREGLEPNPKFKPKEWRMENETTESLIEKGLIKKVV